MSPGGSGYFTCKQNMKLFTSKFKSGGLHEKHVMATWNVGNHLSVCLWTQGNQENPVSRQLFETSLVTSTYRLTNYSTTIFRKTLSEPQISPHQLHFYLRYKCTEALYEIEFSVASLKVDKSSENIRR